MFYLYLSRVIVRVVYWAVVNLHHHLAHSTTQAAPLVSIFLTIRHQQIYFEVQAQIYFEVRVQKFFEVQAQIYLELQAQKYLEAQAQIYFEVQVQTHFEVQAQIYFEVQARIYFEALAMPMFLEAPPVPTEVLRRFDWN